MSVVCVCMCVRGERVSKRTCTMAAGNTLVDEEGLVVAEEACATACATACEEDVPDE